MSGSLSTLFSSPTQASDIFSQTGAFPKQRHVFLVNFLTNPLDVGKTTSGLTYAMKSVDRPNIQPHSEELNQYNKKRHIYTGYKIAPLRMQIYDTADGAAQRMWADYTRYYYGDFNQAGPQMFSGADIYGPFMDGVGNYGFTANARDTDGQFFFKTITILHFYSNTYDMYTLVNPRITSFTPDELDYSEANVAAINIEFVYEAVFLTPSTGQPAAQVPQFSGLFNGNPYDVVGGGVVANATQNYAFDPGLNDPTGTDGIVQSLFGGGFDGSAIASTEFRALSAAAGTGLGVFGNYAFGAASIGGIAFGATISSNLASFAATNPALAATLSLQYANANPLAYTGGSLAGYGATPYGLPGAELSIANTQVSAAFAQTPFGGIQTTLATGVLASSLLGNSGGVVNTPNGVMLSNSAMSIVNSQQPGMVQYGFNPNSTNTYGQSYGYNGPNGYDGPAPANVSNPIPPIEINDDPYDDGSDD
jgi:hypothetical protein